MYILAVDDENLALENLVSELKHVFPDEDIYSTKSGTEAVSYVTGLCKEGKTLDYAFLDIQLRNMTGIELAKRIKELHPRTRILFCTAFSDYAMEAWELHAMGYLLKPVDANSICETLESRDQDWQKRSEKDKKRVRAQTFGNFDIFVNGKPIVFEREKAKELLAYLIDRKGGSVSNAEIAAVLWEDSPYDTKVKNYVRKISSVLKKNLKEAGVEDILVKEWNHLAVDPAKIDCDLYAFSEGDVGAINSYMGEYMTEYSWAEFTNGLLSQKILKTFS
ncbi:MAG: response regulator [Blautia sp.]|nr:response regulator [Blautia sp.]